MAEVFVGNEDISFTHAGGTCPITSTATYRNTDFTRYAISTSNTVYLIAEHWSSELATGYARLTFSKIGSGAINNLPLVVLTASDGTPIARIHTTASNTMQLQYWDGAAWQNVAGTEAVPTGARVLALEWKIDEVDGYVRWRMDSALVGEYVGDTTVSGASTAGKLEMRGADSGIFVYYSEVIIADEDPRDWHLLTLAPSGAGTYAEGTGTYANVDENSASDADVISFDAAGQRTSMALTDASSVVAGLVVGAVHLHARARRNGSGPTRLELGVRGSGADGYASALDLDTAFGTVRASVSQNPGTGAAPTGVQLDDYELILRAAS